MSALKKPSRRTAITALLTGGLLAGALTIAAASPYGDARPAAAVVPPQATLVAGEQLQLAESGDRKSVV